MIFKKQKLRKYYNDTYGLIYLLPSNINYELITAQRGSKDHVVTEYKLFLLLHEKMDRMGKYHAYISVGVKWYRHSGKQLSVQETNMHFCSTSTALSIYPRQMEAYVHTRNLYPNIYSGFLCNSFKLKLHQISFNRLKIKTNNGTSISESTTQKQKTNY